MKKRVLIIVSVLIGISGSLAQNKIQSSVLGNGGTPVSDANRRIHGTLGQTLIGTVQDTSVRSSAGYWFHTLGIVTSVEKNPEILPTDFRLDQNYPNPFNPVTTIMFAIPKSAIVILSLYDLMGREVTVLINKHMEPGEYKVLFDGAGLPSGVYIYRILAGDFAETKRFVLMK